MQKILMTLCAFGLLCGCSLDSKDSKFETGVSSSPHYITEYVVPSEIEVVINEYGFIELRAPGIIHITYGDKSEEAMRLAKLYGDTSFKGSVHPGLNPAFAYPIDEITIHSDADFDVRHPAGESLDDITLLSYATLYEFIRGGYKPLPQEARPGYPEYTDLTHRTLCFNCISPEFTQLMGISLRKYYLGEISFTTSPDIPGEYSFTLSLTTNGETFTTTFTHTFE